jgi:flavin reductase (DIM6/NTAB) family NADH-FMN oxidoreductase RutF|tara:strand:- start:4936 stop:5787 length:852 start_codon:yes stop_codon:yes gene_type:complete
MDISQRREIVSRFLRRCVTYADSSIERKKSRGEKSSEISKWEIYRQFTSFSASEVESGELDTWLEDGDYRADPNGFPSLSENRISLNLEEMSHEERRNWLASLLMPRPISLVATKSSKGIHNLAPMSSIGVVSNSPPMVTISLSKNREGKERDTLVNLRDQGIGSSCMIFILPANLESVKNVQLTSTKTPIDKSEWDLIDEEMIIEDDLSILPSAMVAMRCKLMEIHPLPGEASASLAILQIESIITSDEFSLSSDIQKLMQIDFNKLGPSSSKDDWNFEVSY